MKIIVQGDVHGRQDWKIPAYKEEYDKMVFIGDYWDSFDIPYLEQKKNFEDIVDFKKKNPDKVILLMGNHDGYIYPQLKQYTISGYQPLYATDIQITMQESKKLFQMAYLADNHLFTHAGVTQTWLEDNGWKGEKIDDFINQLWLHKPSKFAFKGNHGDLISNGYGDNIWQPCTWVRPKSLMTDSDKIPHIQVVGHTSVHEIGKKDRYIFVDCPGHYLIINDGQYESV